ncbi:MAG TPA: HEAT repeat domain-containing protein [Bryobacteraceae bacterium]|nr:HEAT repeat domain-containing protein [Bryobacteraceae bacterium]
MLRDDRESFYGAAIDLLRSGDDSRGALYVVSILAAGQLLLRALSDPDLPKERVLALAHAASQTGVMVDVVVAKHLAEQARLLDDNVCPPELQRLMDLLSHVTDGSRVLPFLMALARQPNPHLQSKAVLMIGRINRNAKWVQSRLMDADPRVRANAVEALWGTDSEEVRQLLRAAGHDSNNRVAGNALMALYRLGDEWAIAELRKMAVHESRLFRATAAWVMGETGDPRFTKALARMIGEPNPTVRARAFAALGRIRSLIIQAREAQEWRVISRFQRIRRNDWRELHLEATSQDGHDQVKILPTHLILIADAGEISSFSLEERQVPRSLAITFLYPRSSEGEPTPFQQGALHALGWKRPADQWAIVPFVPTPQPNRQTSLAGEKIEFTVEETPTLELAAPQLTADSTLLDASLNKVALKAECPKFWAAIRRATQVDSSIRGKRNIVLFSQDEISTPSDYTELATAVMSCGIAIHGLSLIPNRTMDSLCQASQGSFQLLSSEDQIAPAVEQIYLSLMARYLVKYQPTEEARSLRMIVNTPPGWGETTIDIPQPVSPRTAANTE